jgi:hypothetical protein
MLSMPAVKQFAATCLPLILQPICHFEGSLLLFKYFEMMAKSVSEGWSRAGWQGGFVGIFYRL